MSRYLFDPPPGYTRLGRNGESYGTNIIAANVVTTVLAIIAFALRIYIKGFILRKKHFDDVLLLLAVGSSIARTVLQNILETHYQLGQHMWDYEMSSIQTWHRVNKSGIIVYSFAIACTKTAVLLFYVRIFGVNRKFKWTCYALILITVGYCLAVGLLFIFQCRPVSTGWTFFGKGECYSLPKILIIGGGFNIATDILIVLVPIPLVSNLQLPLVRKIGILAVLGTGLFVVAVSIVRQVVIVSANHSPDATWNVAIGDMWLSVELNIGIVAVCLPTLAPLGRKLPSKEYFEHKYSSLVSLFRERSRSKSFSQQHKTSSGEDSIGAVEAGPAGHIDKNDSPVFTSNISAGNEKNIQYSIK